MSFRESAGMKMRRRARGAVRIRRQIGCLSLAAAVAALALGGCAESGGGVEISVGSGDANVSDTGAGFGDGIGRDASSEQLDARADVDARGAEGRADGGEPDVEEGEEPGELLGRLDVNFGAEQPTPGLFIGPRELRADPSVLSLSARDGATIAGRGRLGEGEASLFSMRLDSSGALDLAYGDSGVNTLVLGAAEREITVLAGTLSPDGKRVICGNIRQEQLGRAELFVARLNPDGSPDAGFGDDPEMPGRAFFKLPSDAPNSLCWALSVSADQKILVGGQVGANNTMTPLLMRLNPDGSLDAGFGADNEVSGVVLFDIEPENPMRYAKIRALERVEGEKILALVDSVDIMGGRQDGFLLRFNPDGSLDGSFAEPGGRPGMVQLRLENNPSHEVFDFVYDEAGERVFVAGRATPVAGLERTNLFVHGLRADGITDENFASSGTYLLQDYHGAARAILLQPDGKIIAVGSTLSHPDPAFEAGGLLVVRLLSDGSRDTSFASEAETRGVFYWEDSAQSFYAARAALDSRGRLLITGSSPIDAAESPRGHGFVARLR